MMLHVLRILLIPIFMLACFIMYGLTIEIASSLIPLRVGRELVFAALMAQEFVASAGVALIFSYPLGYTYRKAAWLVAIVMCMPIYFFRQLHSFDSFSHVASNTLTIYGLGTIAVLMGGGSILSARYIRAVHKTNLYKPPNSKDLDPNARKGVTHWIAIPIGFIVSGLGVFVLEPRLVDFIIQQLIQLPKESRAVPMLTLDLVLNTTTLTASLYFVVWWARDPKACASAIVALLIAGSVGFLSMSPSNNTPAWYHWSSYASIAIAWWIAQVLHVKLSRDV